MTDRLGPERRSALMSKVRNKNTKPEVLVRRTLHTAGYRFRLHRKDLPGKPDIVLPKYRVAVFVNGCFWHGHGCRRLPQTNADYWRQKIERNKERDAASWLALEQLGWNVYVIWTCDIGGGIDRLLEGLTNAETHLRAKVLS